MKKRYELTVIFSPELSLEDLGKTIKKLETLVEKFEGSFVKREDWGTREFAYPVKKQHKGLYQFMVIEIPGKSIKELDREFKLVEGIMRYLFVAVEK